MIALRNMLAPIGVNVNINIYFSWIKSSHFLFGGRVLLFAAICLFACLREGHTIQLSLAWASALLSPPLNIRITGVCHHGLQGHCLGNKTLALPAANRSFSILLSLGCAIFGFVLTEMQAHYAQFQNFCSKKKTRWILSTYVTFDTFPGADNAIYWRQTLSGCPCYYFSVLGVD